MKHPFSFEIRIFLFKGGPSSISSFYSSCEFFSFGFYAFLNENCYKICSVVLKSTKKPQCNNKMCILYIRAESNDFTHRQGRVEYSHLNVSSIKYRLGSTLWFFLIRQNGLRIWLIIVFLVFHELKFIFQQLICIKVVFWKKKYFFGSVPICVTSELGHICKVCKLFIIFFTSILHASIKRIVEVVEFNLGNVHDADSSIYMPPSTLKKIVWPNWVN